MTSSSSSREFGATSDLEPEAGCELWGGDSKSKYVARTRVLHMSITHEGRATLFCISVWGRSMLSLRGTERRPNLRFFAAESGQC